MHIRNGYWVTLATLLMTTHSAMGYIWTINNALPHDALVRLNVSGQKQRYVVGSGKRFDFNFNKKGGWHNTVAMNGLCLSHIDVRIMGEGTTTHRVDLSLSTSPIIKDAIKSLPDIAKVLAMPESPLAWGKLILDLGKIIKDLVPILKKICSSGDILLIRDPKTKKLHTIKA